MAHALGKISLELLHGSKELLLGKDFDGQKPDPPRDSCGASHAVSEIGITFGGIRRDGIPKDSTDLLVSISFLERPLWG